MDWISFDHPEQLNSIVQDSSVDDTVSVIFKHSTRCGISSMVKRGLEREWDLGANYKAYHLNLIRDRQISNLVEQEFSIRHESPQVIVLKNGEVIHHASHSNIRVESIKKSVAQYLQTQ
jgi:bacillithiol system protein YtxJ